MKLEEYIAKRKKEDGINEFDLQKTADNTRICVNYIFEYFNNYLESRGADNETILHMDKLDKYRQKLNEYDPEIQDWLVNLYSSLTIDKEEKASNKLNVYAVFLSSFISFFIFSFISMNKLYSKSIILSSAFKTNASFSFKRGVINLSAFVKVCLLSQPYSSFTLSSWPLLTSI